MPVRGLPFAVHNASGLNRWRGFLWSRVRRAVPAEPRFFYEGQPGLPGQLWFAERRLLFELVRRIEPEHCYEVGTWTGGGSTLVVATALARNGRGCLHTVEIEPELIDRATEAYEAMLPDVRPHVDFHRGDYRAAFAEPLTRGGVDFLFLDGAERAEETLEQLRWFEPHCRRGTYMAVHDWNSEKARLARPAIEASSRWRVETVLGPPRSVGLAVAEFVGG